MPVHALPLFWNQGEFQMEFLPMRFESERDRVPFVLMLFALL